MAANYEFKVKDEFKVRLDAARRHAFMVFSEIYGTRPTTSVAIEKDQLEKMVNAGLLCCNLVDEAIEMYSFIELERRWPNLQWFVDMVQVDDSGNAMICRQLLFKFWIRASDNSYAKIYKLGWERGIAEIRAISVRRATNGRRLLGATTRSKVAKEAEKIRHKMTKEDASYVIAEVVKKNSGTVKRYLTELFPGDTWKATNQ